MNSPRKSGKPAKAVQSPKAGESASGKARIVQILSVAALSAGQALLKEALNRSLPGRKPKPGKQLTRPKRPTVGGSLLQGAILRVATRSVPGAILVGGGLLAKRLYDRRRASKLAALEAADGDGDGEET